MSNEFSLLLQKSPFSIEQIATELGFGVSTLYKWEKGDTEPRKAAVDMLRNIVAASNKSRNKFSSHSFKFIDLFAGIGGIRIPFEEIGGECVFTSEWDKFAKKTYAVNHGELPEGDITQISAKDIPEHDVLLAGFPCQAFSQAGLKKGFSDTRGTLFFEIQRILSHKKPKAFLLENVKQLKGHNKGETLQTILSILRGESESSIPEDIQMSEEARESLQTKLNFWVDYKVIKATDFGVPQNRERVYIVGFDKEQFPDRNFENVFQWPEATHSDTCLGDVLEENHLVDEKYTISDRLWAGHQRRKKEHRQKGNGFGYGLFNHKSSYSNTISARYYKDGSEVLIDQSELGKNPRKLTPRECARLQGFPEDFIVNCVSDVQAYKQFGNSVSVPVIRAVAQEMIKTVNSLSSDSEMNKEPFARYG